MTDVCIIGAGGQVAEAVSSWLTVRGHRIIHYRPKPVAIPGVPPRPRRPMSRLERFSVSPESTASMDGGFGRHRWVGRQEAARAEVFVFCLPSFLAEFTGHALATSIKSKHIVNVSDRFMGTAALCRAAERECPGWAAASAVALNSPPLLAYQRTRNKATSLLYSKPFVLAAPLVPSMSVVATQIMTDLFGISDIRWMDSTLELAFENINSIVHAVQDLECLKAGLFEGNSSSLYDAIAYQPRMIERINAIALERDAIAARYTPRRYRDLATFDATTFRTATGLVPGTAAYRHHHSLLSTVPRPSIFTAHGYEDVGWAMVPLESLGRQAGIASPALSALIDEWSHLMHTNYRAVGRTAQSLGIATSQ
jgi:hypothetical protein